MFILCLFIPAQRLTKASETNRTLKLLLKYIAVELNYLILIKQSKHQVLIRGVFIINHSFLLSGTRTLTN